MQRTSSDVQPLVYVNLEAVETQRHKTKDGDEDINIANNNLDIEMKTYLCEHHDKQRLIEARKPSNDNEKEQKRLVCKGKRKINNRTTNLLLVKDPEAGSISSNEVEETTFTAYTILREDSINANAAHSDTEWSTRALQVKGEVIVEGWETEVSEISRQEDNIVDWDTSINLISENDELPGKRKITLSKHFGNKEQYTDWTTRFSPAKKVDSNKDVSTSMFRRVRNHPSTKNEWKSNFNSICTKNADKDEWKFNLPRSLSNLSQDNDWNTRFHNLQGRSITADTWHTAVREIRDRKEKDEWKSTFH